MIEAKRVSGDPSWGSYPALSSSVTSKASEVYNAMVHSFTPAALKGVIFISSDAMMDDANGPRFGEQLAALANSWNQRFEKKAPPFFFT